jgi:glycosyltransferase involved in cell wall biosynthesis
MMDSTLRAKVLLLIPHLGGGGAEHITATLAQNLGPEKYEIHLGLATQSIAEQNGFPPWVIVHALGASKIRKSAWKILRQVWRIRPAVILSGMAHLNLLVLMLRPLFPPRTRVLVRQNGALSATLSARKHPHLARRLYAAGYGHADRVICQTQSMEDELRKGLGIDSARLVVLPNPVDLQGIRGSTARANQVRQWPGHRLLAVARLAPEKGIDLLLEAFARVQHNFPKTQLEIAGSGPCEPALKTQCKMLAIDDQVKFLGNVNSPAEQFCSASVFVLSSRHEGLPNALLEAAAAGLPIVALPASPGLVDLLSEQPGVWLASDISADALERALCRALSSIHPGHRFDHSWIEQFDLSKAIAAYERVIDQVLQERRT